MTLTLLLVGKQVSLLLSKDGEPVDKREWEDQNDLSETFFPQLEDLLGVNGATLNDLKDFVLKNDLPEGYTTGRIAKTIMDSLKYGSGAVKK